MILVVLLHLYRPAVHRQDQLILAVPLILVVLLHLFLHYLALLLILVVLLNLCYLVVHQQALFRLVVLRFLVAPMHRCLQYLAPPLILAVPLSLAVQLHLFLHYLVVRLILLALLHLYRPVVHQKGL